MITINALQIRAKLGSILDNVSQKGEHYIVNRLGKPLAIIVPYQDFDHQKNQDAERRKRLEAVAKSIDKWRKKNVGKYSGKDSAVIVRRMRDERTKHLIDVVEGRQ